MSKFNVKGAKAQPKSPVTTQPTATARNYHNAPAFTRDTKSELFLLAVSNMVGANTFYEKAGERDARFEGLVRAVAVQDPQWMASFLQWLRSDANMRSASLVGALEAAKAMVGANIPGSRPMVASVLQRGDEPAEALAYWHSTHGRVLPKPVKRGIADAAVRLFTERNMLKYDTNSRTYRFADVIQLTHPDPKAPWQSALFKRAIGRRLGLDEPASTLLPMVGLQTQLRARIAADPAFVPSADDLAAAGMTWEDTLSLLGAKVDKAKLWEAQIPSMGYMSLLRNLCNFDEAGISKASAQLVMAKLQDPEQVAKSRQFPFRFYAAFKATGSLRWGQVLEEALERSLANVPALSGRTLVLVDQSPSMFPGYYYSTKQQNPQIGNADLAKLFGSAVALRAADATLVGYGNTSQRISFKRGDAVLRLMEKFKMIEGTDTFAAAGAHFDGHSRVVIVTDEQNQAGRYTSIDEVVPKNVPVYTWNIGGYVRGATSSGLGTRHTFAGMTDQAFKMIPLLEAGRDGAWPWTQLD